MSLATTIEQMGTHLGADFSSLAERLGMGELWADLTQTSQPIEDPVTYVGVEIDKHFPDYRTWARAVRAALLETSNQETQFERIKG